MYESSYVMRQINMGTLCPETQPLRLEASELPCEVEFENQAINIQLTENGVLILNEDSRGYTPQMVLTPSRHLNSTHYKDLISDVGITINLTIPTSLKRKISSSNTHTNSVIKLTDLGQYSKSIEEIEQLIQEERDKQNIRILQTSTHTYSILF
ncbi:Uncharacterized protein FWK35_00008353 [Aphis craccivora]|uniref:Uncharacterized protein n=1 Tax=Aphis craccivora TaxID=307492 RepID=A0A6G0YHT3_APHCR|nr:Uncharacterized protein FWK35_00008353 [Aphis craccivora]